jgi:hypothetical protein
MHPEHHIICGGFPRPKLRKSAAPILLNLAAPVGASDQVNLRIDDLYRPFGRDISPRFVDLAEIAAYVYAADQAVTRRYQDTDRFGSSWRRRLMFYIPVRDVDFWQSAPVKAAMSDVLDFLGDHFFSFQFIKATSPRPYQEYLTYPEDAKYLSAYDQIAMFSGGLDSLAGAIDALKREHLRMAFVTHIPTTKNEPMLRVLRRELAALSPDAVPLHIGIEVNKAKVLGKEHTQRTRSFLFACLGATAAHALGLSSLRFYENGVVSLNLPLCGQVIGGRATRTTHPKVLVGFEKLFGLVFEAPFRVTNPFLDKTKAEVIRVITGHGQQGLIGKSITCAHTWERGAEQTHCGYCSQCLDRRLAMLAADAFEHDPESIYKTNIFTASLPEASDRILVASYIERARTLKHLHTPEDFVVRYPQLYQALPHIEGASPDRAAKILFDLYRRHGADVDQSITTICKKSFQEIYEHKLPSDCLIRIVTDATGTTPAQRPPTYNPVADPEYVFHKQDDVWEIRFRAGRRFYLSDHSTGCAYLHYLITNPGESFTAHQLQLAVFPRAPAASLEEVIGSDSQDDEKPGLEVSPGLSDGGVTLDEEGKKQIQGRLAEVEEELSDATKLDDEAEMTRLTDEKKSIEEYLRSSLNMKGEARKIQDPVKRMNDAVSASLRRLIGAVRKKDKSFAAHLSDRNVLCHGSVNFYRPPASIAWAASDHG